VKPADQANRPPVKRYGHSAVVRDDEMWVFGGFDSDSWTCSDLWSFHFRMRHLSSLGCELVIDVKGMPTLTLVSLCACTVNKEWRRSEFKKNKPAPAPRFQHSAVYSRARDRMFVFGGQGDKNAVMADLWSFDFSCVSLSLLSLTFTCSFLWASCASHLLLVGC
jgi:hypothetical protein